MQVLFGSQKESNRACAQKQAYDLLSQIQLNEYLSTTIQHIGTR